MENEVLLQKTIKGFRLKKREFDKKLYQQHICNKENKIFAELFATRGIKVADKDDYLDPKLKNLLPKICILKDIKEGVDRLFEAIKNNDKVCIFGDYDVDGTTATAMLLLYLQGIGICVDYYIPNRLTEGYGLNNKAIDKFAKDGIKLLICVDCGATCIEQIEKAKSLGIDVIVIDHHKTAEKNPDCIAHINPNRFDEKHNDINLSSLCACGVCFLFIISLNSKVKELNKNIDLIQFTPLVAFATICDVMTLTSLNRAFVKTGILVLNKDRKFNLFSLIDVINDERENQNNNVNTNNKKTIQKKIIEINATTFGFLIGPMINAGGRIGESQLGVKLIIERNRDNAYEIAKQLYDLNEERKQIETDTIKEISNNVSNLQKEIDNFGFLMVYNRDWHEGVIGLVASRLKDKFYYPVMAGAEKDGIVKFSCRSVEGIDIGNLILLARDKGIILEGGGHKMAAGFSCDVKKIDELKQFLKEQIKDSSIKFFEEKVCNYDTALSLGGLNFELLKIIEKFEPFGAGNERPVFLLQDVFIANVFVIKDKHISLILTDKETTERAICFNCIGTDFGNYLLSLKGKNANFIVSAHIEQYNGNDCVNIKIEDAVE